MTERINPPTGILGNILEALRFRGTIFFRSQLAAPWGMSLDDEKPMPCFHIALSGGFFVGHGAGKKAVPVDEMEIIMLPKGDSHWIADRPGRPLIPSKRARQACQLDSPFFQSGSITNQLMCGQVRFDPDVSHPLLDALPAIIRIACDNASSRIWRLVELIDGEIGQRPPAGGPLVDRLTEALFLLMLEAHVESSEEASGFVAALRDQRLAHTLKLIHQQPEAPWTLDDLAKRAHMSRATLLRHFRASVGMAPIEYLTSWRLLRAHDLAKHSSEPLERIAARVGFSSAQTLRKAFKRHFDYSPSSLRNR